MGSEEAELVEVVAEEDGVASVKVGRSGEGAVVGRVDNDLFFVLCVCVVEGVGRGEKEQCSYLTGRAKGRYVHIETHTDRDMPLPLCMIVSLPSYFPLACLCRLPSTHHKTTHMSECSNSPYTHTHT